jgi:hypothetical protein
LDDNIRVGPGKIRYKIVDFIYLLQDVVHWGVLVKTLIKSLASYEVEIPY